MRIKHTSPGSGKIRTSGKVNSLKTQRTSESRPNLKFLENALLAVLALSLITPLLVPAQGFTPLPNPIKNACDNFLPNLFNPNVWLLNEALGSHSIFVASDNLLFPRAFDFVCYEGHPSLADEIRMSVNQNPCCNQANDSMHEAVFGLPIPLPIHTANLYNVNSTWRNYCCYSSYSNYTVYYENHNGTGILSDAVYGDVAAYTALELEREGNQTAALREIAILNWMYDGRGIADDVYRYGSPGERGMYQTFKDALYLLALTETGQRIPTGLEKTILSMQGQDGGFHTGYNLEGNYTGTEENVETTTLSMLALHSVPAHIYIEGAIYFNITGTGSVRAVKTNIWFFNLENWTVDVDVTAYWDNTTEIIGSEHITDVTNTAQSGGACYHCNAFFTHNVTFDPSISHFLRIYAGNSSTVQLVYRAPYMPTAPPSSAPYWYDLLGAVNATTVLLLVYKRKRTRDARTQRLANLSTARIWLTPKAVRKRLRRSVKAD